MRDKVIEILRTSYTGMELNEDLAAERILNLFSVINWLNIEDEQPLENQKIKYIGNLQEPIEAVFLYKDGQIGWAKNENGVDCFDEWTACL